MRYLVQRISMVGRLSGYFLLAGTIWLAGCRQATPEIKPSENTQLAVDDKADQRRAEKLLQQQMEIYDKMTELYDKAITKEELEEVTPEISKLRTEFNKVKQEFDGLPTDAKKDAETALNEQMRETVYRFLKIKNRKRSST